MDKKRKKAELLAPAGNFEALRGALQAGADAVYLGGRLFGARAYADNFSDEEILAGIRLAHLFGRKIYLTVNTLIKEKELDGLYDFLRPFYDGGLDGVIVQDLGALALIRDSFPGLELHASTQMTITGNHGAELLKKMGVVRIVPARELGLAELRELKKDTGMELEVFIHGAMCYCYSGQCLFSSILGGRSGNRGRCAQPCRLPYQLNGGKNCYPLSMKDMCTIDLLPELIEAGIDSFKIEGRMKSPAYAAGVTAIYRKYIDLYYENRDNYHISEKDRARLNALYIRSGIGEGYYHRTNGREMITLDSPAYRETGEELLKEIEETYIRRPLTCEVKAEITLKTGEPAKLTLLGRESSVCVHGGMVEKSLKQPLTEEKIIQQIKKSGNTLLDITDVAVEADPEIFMPVRALNELRREAVLAMENRLIAQAGFGVLRKESVKPGSIPKQMEDSRGPARFHIHASVMTRLQLEAALETQTGRIYLDYSLLTDPGSEEIRELLARKRQEGYSFYLTTPYIVRKKELGLLQTLEELLESALFDGVLVRNLESFSYFSERTAKPVVPDVNLYLWNRKSVELFSDYGKECYLPLEENVHEWKELTAKTKALSMNYAAVVYGHLPMMITANCVKKTLISCDRKPGIVPLTDRYQKQFPVYTDCRCCYNVIYNCVPLSLHRLFEKREFGELTGRVDLTLEGKEEALRLLDYYKTIAEHYREPFFKEYTTGHYKRGVE